MNPLYTEKDLVFDTLLVGAWTPLEAKEGSKETWAFTKAGEKLYQLQQTDEEGCKADFEARLVKLGTHLFLDLYLTKVEGDDIKLNAWAGFSLVPAHLILKVEQIGPALKIATMNPDWMKKFIKQHPDAIAHRVVLDDNIVLTASTGELQKFVLEHAGQEDFFGGAMEMRRRETLADKDWKLRCCRVGSPRKEKYMKTLANLINAAARPLDGARRDYDPLLDMIGDARIVVLGAQTHGTHEFYRERARITQRLIAEKEFAAVTVEADWPDAYRVNRFIRGESDDTDGAEALGGLRLFRPGYGATRMWWISLAG